MLWFSVWIAVVLFYDPLFASVYGSPKFMRFSMILVLDWAEITVESYYQEEIQEFFLCSEKIAPGEKFSMKLIVWGWNVNWLLYFALN